MSVIIRPTLTERRAPAALACVQTTLVLIGAVAAPASTQQPAPAARALVFDNITVVDVKPGKLSRRSGPRSWSIVATATDPASWTHFVWVQPLVS